MLITAILFIVFGILIKYGKMYFLIAGYNTMSKEEKEKYDIERIATVFRNVMFGMGFMIILRSSYCETELKLKIGPCQIMLFG